MRDALVNAYLDAKDVVLAEGYEEELVWQERVSMEDLSESRFLSEAAWVVLCCGMSEAVVKGCFLSLTAAFCGWSASSIISNQDTCRSRALAVFGHAGKINAIVDAARIVMDEGIDMISFGLILNGPDYLRRFSYIGPVTSRHLAKNLGMPLAKADRHLERIRIAAGYPSTLSLCTALSDHVGDPVPVVDLVLWRFATIERGYTRYFDGSQSS